MTRGRQHIISNYARQGGVMVTLMAGHHKQLCKAGLSDMCCNEGGRDLGLGLRSGFGFGLGFVLGLPGITFLTLYFVYHYRFDYYSFRFELRRR